jgi:hypothetical protein
MPRISSEFREQVKSLSKDDLEKIILKVAAKEKSVYDYLVLNYFNTEDGEQDLVEEVKSDLDDLFMKNYKGYAPELKLANMVAACTKRINEFSKISSNKKHEADLLVYILDVPFSKNSKLFGTCFTAYDQKVTVMLKRLITIVTTKLDPDYLIDYQDKINKYLEIIHHESDFLEYVRSLPRAI